MIKKFNIKLEISFSLNILYFLIKLNTNLEWLFLYFFHYPLIDLFCLSDSFLLDFFGYLHLKSKKLTSCSCEHHLKKD